MKLSEIIKMYRKENKLSLRAFADKTDFSFQYISNLENGLVKNPSITVLQSISKAMNKTLDELLRETDDFSISLNDSTETEKKHLTDDTNTSNEAREIFIKNLKRLMNKREKSQTDIAKSLGIPLSTVSSWYNGQSYPRVDSMQRLADYLNVSMKDLTDDTDETPEHFTDPQEALEYILKVPMVANFGGYDLERMTDDEIIEMANDLLEMIKILGKRSMSKKG